LWRDQFLLQVLPVYLGQSGSAIMAAHQVIYEAGGNFILNFTYIFIHLER